MKDEWLSSSVAIVFCMDEVAIVTETEEMCWLEWIHINISNDNGLVQEQKQLCGKECDGRR